MDYPAVSLPVLSPASRAESDPPAQTPNSLVRLCFYLVVFMIPFGHFYIPGTGERLGASRLSQICIVGAILLQPRLCFSRIPFAFFAFLAYTLFRVASGCWFSWDLRETWMNSTIVLLDSLVLFVFLFNLLLYPGMARLALWALVVGAFLTACCQVVGWGVSTVQPWEGRLSVFGENANVVGLTYGVGLLCLFGLFFASHKWPITVRIVSLPVAAVILYALAQTASRGGVLVFGIGFLLMACSTRSGSSRFAHAILVLLTFSLVLGVFATRPMVVDRFLGRNKAPSPQGEARARMYPVLWEMFLRQPCLGGGPDTYKYEMTGRASPDRYAKGIFLSAHNLVLMLLVETGILGAGLYFAGFATVAYAAFHTWRRHQYIFPLALVVSLAALGVFGGVVHYSRVYWLVMAYALAARSDT